MPYSIGLDYGTNSVRALIIDVKDGRELGVAVYEYESGTNGIILDPSDHNVARQNPADYLKGIEVTVTAAISDAQKAIPDFDAHEIIGIGIDTTGSTPLAVNEEGTPLALTDEFKDNPNAMAWLWKDHTSFAEASEITELAKKEHPEYLAKCGGIYSSEWFFSKLLHCLRVDEAVFDAAFSWVEYCDWLPAVLAGDTNPLTLKRSICAAGHKAMFSKEWGGLPAKDFLAKLDPKLGDLRDRLYSEAYAVDTEAGKLCSEWATKLGLKEGIPIAVGAFDAHLGAVGSGIGDGTMVKIMGTSCCDMVVGDLATKLSDIPGICGIVEGSVLPGFYGLEAGQSAVGDLYNWFVNSIEPGGAQAGSHVSLTQKAKELKPGESGLIYLDWNNGNRTILVDQRLTGLLIGQTLHTKPYEIYRALVEATAFGALSIINRFEEYGVSIDDIVVCGGIAEKNAMVMQIFADITNRQMKVSSSSQTCALGAAIAASVVAGSENGGYDSCTEAQKNICFVKDTVYKPIAENVVVYEKLFRLYMQLHDGFGVKGSSCDMSNVMKDLLEIKDQANA